MLFRSGGEGDANFYFSLEMARNASIFSKQFQIAFSFSIILMLNINWQKVRDHRPIYAASWDHILITIYISVTQFLTSL